MNGKIRKAMKKIFKLLLLVLAVCALYMLLMCIFHEQCKDIAGWYIAHEVKENQEALNEAIKEIGETDEQFITSKDYPETGIWYKELNYDSVTEAFNELNLFSVSNNMDGSQVRTVDFLPKIGRSLFLNSRNLFTLNTFICGFYYSEEDIPVDVFWTKEECEEEFEGMMSFVGNYHYQTERIVPNWWCYEVTHELTYGTTGRR